MPQRAPTRTIRLDSPFARRLKAAPILVIDDSPFIRRMVREMLHSFSARNIVEASDGHQGWIEANRLPPKVIILDWFMPNGSGPDFMKALRHDQTSPCPKADVVVITGIPTLKVINQAQQLGVASVIRKPFAPRDLYDRLASSSMRLNWPDEVPKALPPEPEPLPLPLAEPWRFMSPHRFGDDVGRPAPEVDPRYAMDRDVWAI